MNVAVILSRVCRAFAANEGEGSAVAFNRFRVHQTRAITGSSKTPIFLLEFALLQINPVRKVYDVCIIGSGAGGGTAAKVLTEGGLNVVMIEAGPRLVPVRDFKEHVWPYDLPHRGGGEGLKLKNQMNSEFMAPNGYWEIEGEPYTSAPGTNFRWFRSRIEGGRTNHWGRIALRFGSADFRPHSTDGLGDDWPITYEDLAPYYDKVESYIGVFGTEEHVPNSPGSSVYQPPPKPRCTETIIKKACDRLNITCIPSRMAILTKALNGRPACHYCAQCGRGCITASNFSSSQVMIPPAAATGRFTMIANAMARELVLGKSGKVEAVSYIDKATRTEQRVYAKSVVVAASACESARLLLNSRSSDFPNGIANSSGAVGRYLTDSVGSDLAGYFPQLENMPSHNHDGTGGMHMYMPWWLFGHKNDFPRGYHIEFGGGRDMPGLGSFDGVCEEHEGYGASLKQRCRSNYGNYIGFSGRGEMIPNENSYCELDPNVVDRWGIPVLRFHWQWSDYELKQAQHMRQTFAAIIEAAGGTVIGGTRRHPHVANPQAPEAAHISQGGEIIHELGTVRMGSDPKKSVLNDHCQAHDVKNLFVADAAPFVSNPDKNPTLSIMALSWRTSEHILDQAKKGEL
jgi:choline dehydrogenase-like flavoprotein